MKLSFLITDSLAAGRSLTRQWILGLCFLILFVGGSIPALRAQSPANDSFSARIAITGSTNSVSVDNTGATGEPGEPNHVGNPPSASVWWTWVAPDSGPVTMDTAGSKDGSGNKLDTLLSVYTGDQLNALSLIAEDDDAPNLPTSLVHFVATQGTVYQIAVDGYSGAYGTVTLNLRLAASPSAPSVTSQPAGRLVVDGDHSDVTLSVRVTGSLPLSFSWRKDAATLPGVSRPSYTVTNAHLADAGDYRVIVSNLYGSVTSSVARLTVLSPVQNDAFATRLHLAGQTGTTAGNNFHATREAGEPTPAGVLSGASVWWSWTAPKNGLVTWDTDGSVDSTGAGLDTVLGVYVGSSLNSLLPVAANDDETVGLIRSSKVLFRAAAGVTYQIAVAGLPGLDGLPAVGYLELHWTQAADNDFFSNALPFPPGASQVRDNNTGATTEVGEPQHAGNLGGNSVWWSWVAPGDGTFALDTEGSTFDTILGVYTGNSVNVLTLMGEDDNRNASGASLVKFFGIGGSTYYFAVDGHSGTNGAVAGDIVLNLNATLVLNDDFAERLPLSGQTNRVAGSNLTAGKEPGEPNHGGNAGGRSLWWTWTAHITGPVLISTRNSTFDTSLAVYTGSELALLTLIAENEDADPTDPSAGSIVNFQGIAGKTYQIAVDGYRASDGTVAAGTVELALIQATPSVSGGNDLFVNRFPITGQTATVIGVNTNASKESGEPSHDGNDGGRSLWWSWVAPASAPVRLDTFGSGFDTLLGVYQGTDVGALTLVGADTSSGDNGKSIVTWEAVEGMEYQIAVDGFNDGTGAASGRVVLNLRQYPPSALHANDDFANATPISAPFLKSIGNNIGATRQVGETAHGLVLPSHSVWWTWIAPADGAVTISTVGSQFDTVLGVYTGTSVDALTLVAENDDIDPGYEQSSVAFQAVAGTDYRLAVDGYGNEFGFIVLTVSPELDSPTPPTLQQAPADQTRYAGGAGGGTNVSFRVLATGSLPLSYQWLHNGTNLPDATDNVLTVTNPTPAAAGTYRVKVSNAFGLAISPGAELTLLASPFNDDFANRIRITGPSNVVRGSILGATKQPSEPDHGGDVGGRSVWWKWLAVSNGPVEVHTLGSSFDTLLAVYTGGTIDNLDLVGENDDLLSDQVYASRVVFNAVAGREYQFAVDGFKTNTASGSVLLNLRQPPPLPMIIEQPHGLELDHPTNINFSVGVAASGLTPLFQYQWLFNGTVIMNATNSSYNLDVQGRTNSGSYSVVVANDFGRVSSSNATLWVKVPQRLQPPQLLPDGRLRLIFSDPDGTLSSEPSRFEIQYSVNLVSPTPLWITDSGGITVGSGRFLFEDPTGGREFHRFFRVIEK